MYKTTTPTLISTYSTTPATDRTFTGNLFPAPFYSISSFPVHAYI